LRLALVGCGPRGLFALERLAISLDRVVPDVGVDLAIDIFEPHLYPGAGPNYDPDQPDFLIMNFASRHVDPWSRPALLPGSPTLVEWLEQNAPERADPDGFVPRALVGEMLHEGFERVVEHLEAQGVAVEIFERMVGRVAPAGSGSWAVTAEAEPYGPYDEVLVATGHASSRRSDDITLFQGAVPLVIGRVFPVDRFVDPPSRFARDHVLVRGFALTWIDATLALTEGTGGRFVEDPSTRSGLRYEGSPRDPASIAPYSRTGRPPRAKPEPGRVRAPVDDLESLWQEGRDRLRKLGDDGGLSVPEDLQPLLVEIADRALAAAGIADREVAGALEHLLNTRVGQTPDPDALLAGLEIARGERPVDALWALGETWRRLYPALVERLGDGQLPAGEWPAFTHLARAMERIAFGPPAVNVAKMLALHEADLLVLPGDLEPEEIFERADAVVDAVLPAPGVDGTSPVLGRLLEEGVVRHLAGTQGLETTPSAQAVSPAGEPVDGLSIVGRATEGSAIGHDTLSRTLHDRIDRWAERVVADLAGSPRNPVRTGCRGLAPLDARLEPWQEAWLAAPGALHRLVEQYGSPVNVLHVAPFEQNAQKLRAVAREHGVPFRLFFARKANKALAFVDAARNLGLGLDTASLEELEQALDRGFAASDVVVTAAVKSEPLLTLAAHRGVTVALDGVGEARSLARVAAKAGSGPAPVALRLSGFHHQGEKLFSRFGFDVETAEADVATLWAEPEVRDHLAVRGLHFHLDGYDPDQRVSALGRCLELVEALRSAGHEVAFVDMGGGLPVCYLESREQWDDFWSRLDRSLLGESDPITYRNHGLGRFASDGRVVGDANSYPYHQDLDARAWLDQVLGKVADDVRRLGLELRAEPGRSLLDGSGLTVARVEQINDHPSGHRTAVVAMNRTQCRTGSDDFLVDPLLVPDPAGEERVKESDRPPTYLLGAYCIENDVLAWRALDFPLGLRPGDLVAWPNTAGYFMHFLESRSHQLPLAQNVVVPAAPDNEDGELDAIDCP
jgi:diaminopimelate decarboxylase